jgi:hypothetical protein
MNICIAVKTPVKFSYMKKIIFTLSLISISSIALAAKLECQVSGIMIGDKTSSEKVDVKNLKSEWLQSVKVKNPTREYEVSIGKDFPKNQKTVPNTNESFLPPKGDYAYVSMALKKTDGPSEVVAEGVLTKGSYLSLIAGITVWCR